ncbi:MAG TPA: sterol desaturase family protein [Steroidobacteraceae bacterium]|jgi:sterol desaturase/sphingolipid hydroxylase (fatty acid hydroxylase superfamily)|nr:sterol desaturase family protein [Steroidobacteraceae bacterium]
MTVSTKFTYYSDFVVYPIAIVALVGANSRHVTLQGGETWLGACLAGLVLWTLLEYLIHRFALHRMPIFTPMHTLHHSAPLAYIATPSWISVSVWLGVVMLPVWWYAGFNVADGITVGLMIGYWWYGWVHHVIHHHTRKPTSAYFGELRAWHMRHHHSPKRGNFGVTTHVWDHVFATVISAKTKAVLSP